MPSAAEILAQLDAAAEEDDFPMLNNAYVRPAATRLTAFSGRDEWLVVFQVLGDSEQHGPADLINVFGNRVPSPPAVQMRRLLELDEAGIDPLNFSASLGGPRQRFTLTRDNYAGAGIDIDNAAPPALKILRYLATVRPEDLFVPSAELPALVDRKNADLGLLLEVDAWRHPDLGEDERPSDSPCLRALAEALATGNASAYRCDPATFNTHWSHWERYYEG